MNQLVSLNHVYKTYRSGTVQVEALRGVNLTVDSGEMIAIMGPSGSGKSTLMHLIGLLDRPTQGELYIDGKKITLNLPDNQVAALRSEKIGFVFQSFNLLSRLNALDNVLLPHQYAAHPQPNAHERATTLLTRVGLQHRIDHRPNQLSGGEKQRVAIARALINNPSLILADEPTGNLDSKSGGEVLQILKELNKDGKTVIIITHDEYVANQCSRIIKFLDGQIVSN